MNRETKNDLAWKLIFNKYDIINSIKKDGAFKIQSNTINEYRESRLMTKFDHQTQLPKIFKDNNLSIIPISRNEYLIGNFKTHHSFEPTTDNKIIYKQPLISLESLDYNDIRSESTAINCAFIADILQDFTNEPTLFHTISGRMSSSNFNFQIDTDHENYNVEVNNSQIEIDGGFEGDNSLILIEAKNYLSDDFIIRQLYYPYKLWISLVNKKVRPIFLSYSNGIFHLREYEFQDNNLYNSIKLKQYKKYSIINEFINTEVILDIINNTDTINEPQIPFPQADNFERIINLCELLKQENTLSKNYITQNYNFDPRQSDYYSNAGKYLGLIENADNSHKLKLSQKGIDILNYPINKRQLEFIKSIICHKVFKDSLSLYLKKGEPPTKMEIIDIMKHSNLYKIKSEETYHRRSSTILSWINWIIELIDE